MPLKEKSFTHLGKRANMIKFYREFGFDKERFKDKFLSYIKDNYFYA